MSATSNSDPPPEENVENSGVLARHTLARWGRERGSRARARAATRATNSEDAAAKSDAPAAARKAPTARAGRAVRPSQASSKAATATARARNARARAARPSTPAAPSKPTTPTPKLTPPPARNERLAAEQIPPQGYEADDDSLRGPVRPPGGPELVASAAELAGELAKTGVTRGARLIKDFLAHLPG